jgi:hypothetical protein
MFFSKEKIFWDKNILQLLLDGKWDGKIERKAACARGSKIEAWGTFVRPHIHALTGMVLRLDVLQLVLSIGSNLFEVPRPRI